VNKDYQEAIDTAERFYQETLCAARSAYVWSLDYAWQKYLGGEKQVIKKRGIKLVAADEPYAEAQELAEKDYNEAIFTAKNAYVRAVDAAGQKYLETTGEIDKERREKSR